MDEISDEEVPIHLQNHWHVVERVRIPEALWMLGWILKPMVRTDDLNEGAQLVLDAMLDNAYRHVMGLDIHAYQGPEMPPPGVVLEIGLVLKVGTQGKPRLVLRAEVHEEGPVIPRPTARDGSPWGFSPRPAGLLPLDLLTSGWGAEPEEGGVVMWAEWDLGRIG